MTHPSTAHSAPRHPHPSQSDWPSYLYLSLFVLNSVALMTLQNPWLLMPLAAVQGVFFMGLLELNHQAVHRAFVTHRSVNEVVGTLAAALVGLNMVAYRYFHLEHHQHTCDTEDPEGHLYADSPRTRLFFFVAPIAHLWVAFGINKLASRYVPQAKRPEWQRAQLALLMVLFGLMCWAVLAPKGFIFAYLLPLCLFAWFDFLFSQAEHYEAGIRDVAERIDVSSVSYDVRVPLWLSHLMLNRNLHRVHHIWPRTRWFEAPQRLLELDRLQPQRVLSLPDFCVRWVKGGPRLWK